MTTSPTHGTDEPGLNAGLNDIGEAINRTRTELAQQMETARIAALVAHAAGFPIATIARDLGVSRPTIYTWINGPAN